MAIIGKIREKSILLVMIIGLALLAFILSDYKNMFGVNEGEYGIGHVFGEKIDETKFNYLKQKYGDQNASVTKFQMLQDVILRSLKKL